MAVKKTPIAVAVPKSYAAANALLLEHGELSRKMERAATRLAAATARLTARIEMALTPIKARQSVIEAQLHAYADQERAELTEDNRVKFHDMPAGRIGWRSNPASVKWAKGLNGEHVVANVRALLAKMREEAARASEGDGATEAAIERIGVVGTFIRTKEEPNKDTMLANTELALTVPGVRIGSAGETFYFEPKALKPVEG